MFLSILFVLLILGVIGGISFAAVTDAAGGYVDGNTKAFLAKEEIDIYQVLQENDAYPALKKADGLIMTGATGSSPCILRHTEKSGYG